MFEKLFYVNKGGEKKNHSLLDQQAVTLPPRWLGHRKKLGLLHYIEQKTAPFQQEKWLCKTKTMSNGN